MKIPSFQLKHIWWCLLLIYQVAPAQSTDDQENFVNYQNVSGNPYLFKDWADGVVRFTSGRVVNQFKLKFDCARNQLLLQFNGSSFAAQSTIQEFVLYTGSGKKKDSVLFRKGYPAVEKGTEDTYYQVLFQGKVLLLRLNSRKIIEEKQVIGNSPVNRRLEEDEKYYMLQDKVMTLLPQDKSELPKVFPGKEELIARFISEHQLKMRTAGDFVQVVKKYNEL